MANTILTPSIIANEALLILENNLTAANTVFRDYESEFTGSRVGDTITIRKPAAFTVNEFTSSITKQDITETSVSMQLEKHFDVSTEVTSRQMTLDLDGFSERVIEPAMVALAEQIDGYIYDQYCWNSRNPTSFIGELGRNRPNSQRAKGSNVWPRWLYEPSRKSSYDGYRSSRNR
jgi:hypothetical protein